ncbi:MAG: LamG-like jellyroll fold domain-containing protein [Nonlabens sp.]
MRSNFTFQTRIKLLVLFLLTTVTVFAGIDIENAKSISNTPVVSSDTPFHSYLNSTGNRGNDIRNEEAISNNSNIVHFVNSSNYQDRSGNADEQDLTRSSQDANVYPGDVITVQAFFNVDQSTSDYYDRFSSADVSVLGVSIPSSSVVFSSQNSALTATYTVPDNGDGTPVLLTYNISNITGQSGTSYSDITATLSHVNVYRDTPVGDRCTEPDTTGLGTYNLSSIDHDGGYSSGGDATLPAVDYWIKLTPAHIGNEASRIVIRRTAGRRDDGFSTTVAYVELYNSCGGSSINSNYVDGEVDFSLDGTQDYFLKVTDLEDIIIFKDTSWNCSTGTVLTTDYGNYTVTMDIDNTYVDGQNIQTQFFRFTTGADLVDATFTLPTDGSAYYRNTVEIYDECNVDTRNLVSNQSSNTIFDMEEDTDDNGFPMDVSQDITFDSGTTYYIKFTRDLGNYDSSNSGTSFSYVILEPCQDNTLIPINYTTAQFDQEYINSEDDRLFKVNVPTGTPGGIYRLSANSVMGSSIASGDSISFYIYSSCPETSSDGDEEDEYVYIDNSTQADSVEFTYATGNEMWISVDYYYDDFNGFGGSRNQFFQMGLSFVRYDLPELTAVGLTSDNGNSAFAKAGDTVTLTFTADAPIDNVITTIAGQNVTATNTTGNDWTASYILTGTETDGDLEFGIDYTLPGRTERNDPIATTTDSGALTIDNTAPVISLNGDAVVSLITGDAFTDPGTTVTETNLGANRVMIGGDTVDVNTSGTYVITYNATDAAGNTAVEVTRSVVVDALPVAIAQDLTVQLDANGQATITPAQVDNGSSDAEGPVTLSLDRTTFDCSDASVGVVDRNSIVFNNGQNVTAANSSLPTGNQARTVEAWVYPTSNGGQSFIELGNGTSTNQRFGLLMIGGNLYFVGQSNDLNTGTSVPLNQWSHIAATHNGTTLRVYLNGVEVGSANKTFNTGAGTVVLGGRLSGGESYTGKLAEVRYWDRALTATEIQNQRNQILTGSESGLVAYYPFSEGTGNATADLTGNGADLVISNINSTDAWDTAYPSLITLNGGIPVTLTVTDTNGSTATATANITVEDNIAPVITCPEDIVLSTTDANGMVVTYTEPTFSDNCLIEDNTAPVVNGYTLSGRYGNSFYYVPDQNKSYSALQNDAINMGGYLVKITSAEENTYVKELLEDVPNLGFAYIGLTDSANEGIYVWEDGTAATYLNWATGEPNNVNNEDHTEIIVGSGLWNDANASRRGNSRGVIEVPATTRRFSGIASGEIFPIGTTTVTREWSFANGQVYTCSFDVTVNLDTPPTAIAQDLTVQLDENGQATITPQMVDNGSSDAEGAVTLSLDKTVFNCSDASGSSMEGVLRIDGTASGTLNLGNVDNFTSAYTIESWFNTSSTSQQNLFSKFHSGVYGHFLIWQLADGRVKASNSVGPYDLSVQPESTTAINDGNWHHVAVSYGSDATSGGSNIKIYIDGALEATSVNQGINSQGSRVPFIIGTEGANFHQFGGKMDDILIWNTARTQAEILEDMKGNVVGNPLRHYDGSLDTMNQLTDNSSNNGHIDLSSLASISIQYSGIPVFLNASDTSGSSAFAKAYIIVEDNIAPVITCPSDITVVSTDANGIAVNYTDPTFTDNCYTAPTGVPVVNGYSLSGFYGNSYYYVADIDKQYSAFLADAATMGGYLAKIESAGENEFIRQQLARTSGSQYAYIGANDIAAEGTFVWQDGTALIYNSWAAGEPNNANGGEDVTAIARNSGEWVDVLTSSNTRAIIEVPASYGRTTGFASGEIFPVGTTTVTNEWTINGQSYSCSFDVTVNLDTPPTAVAQDLTVQLDANGQATITPQMVDNGSSDVQGAVTLSLDRTTFDCDDASFIIPVTLTVTDNTNNTTTAMANVTVSDVTAPTLTLIGNSSMIVVQYAAFSDPGAIATDNCAADTQVFATSNLNTSTIGLQTLTYEYSDSENNTGTITRRVNVVSTPDIFVDSTRVVSCAGSSDGRLEVSWYNGTAPYTLSGPGLPIVANINGTNYTFNGLNSGSYNVTITDANNQTASVNGFINSPSPIRITTSVVSGITCPGENDATITATAQGGNGNLDIEWVGQGFSNTITGVGPGTYTVRVRESFGSCTATATLTVTDPTPITPSAILVNGTLSDNGTTGGTGTLMLEWLSITNLSQPTVGTVAGTGSTFTPAMSGDYALKVTDGNGCKAFASPINVQVSPTLTSVSLGSDNANSAFAKAGDTATLNFTADQGIQNVTATIAGQTATVINTAGNDYEAYYTFNGSEGEGVVAFTIDFESADGRAGAQVSGVTDNSSLITDFTAPVLTLNGDAVIDINLGATYTEQNANATDTNIGSNMVVVAGDMVDTATAGTYVVTYDVMDRAGNAAVQLTRTINVVDPIPSLTSLSIASDNGDSAFAKAGDTATLSFTGSNALNNVTATIAGQPATVTNTSGNDWTASYTFNGTEAEGIVPFTIDFESTGGTSGTQVTATTDSSSVTADFTAPLAVVQDLNRVLDGNGTASIDVMDALVSIDAVDPENYMTYDAVQFKAQHPSSNNFIHYASGYATMTSGGEVVTMTALNATDATVRAGDELYLQTVNRRFNESAGRGMMWRSWDRRFVWELHNSSRDTNMRMSISQTGKTAGEPINFDEPFYLKLVSENRYVSTGSTNINLSYGSAGTNNEILAVLESGQSLNNTLLAQVDSITASRTSFDCADTSAPVSVTITVKDAAGNEHAQNIDVTISDNELPVISISNLGDAYNEIPLGGTFTDPGANVSDNCTVNMNQLVTTVTREGQPATFDSSVQGSYVFTYDYTDTSGNAAISVDRVVNVVTAAPPVMQEVRLSSNNAFDGNYAKENDVITLYIRADKAIQLDNVILNGDVLGDWRFNQIDPATYQIDYIIGRYYDIEGSVAISIDYSDLSGQAGTTVTSTTDGSAVIVDLTDPKSEVTEHVTGGGHIAKPGDVVKLRIDFEEPVAEDFEVSIFKLANTTLSFANGDIILVDSANYIYEASYVVPAEGITTTWTIGGPSSTPSDETIVGDWWEIGRVTDRAGNQYSHYESSLADNNPIMIVFKDADFVYENGIWTPNDPALPTIGSTATDRVEVRDGNAIVGTFEALDVNVFDGATITALPATIMTVHNDLWVAGTLEFDVYGATIFNAQDRSGRASLNGWNFGTTSARHIELGENVGQTTFYGDIDLTGSITGNGSSTSRIYSSDKSFRITFKSSAARTAVMDYEHIDFYYNPYSFINAPKVMVERWFSGVRKFRLVSTPISTSYFYNPTLPGATTIFDNWQEGGKDPGDAGYQAGYGTQITGTGGSANGFDGLPNNPPSMFGFDNLAQNWTTVTETNSSSSILRAGDSYRLMVRGDRGVVLGSSNPVASPTVLRAYGELLRWDRDYDISSGLGTFNMIGNPYQAIYDIAGQAADVNDAASLTGINPNKMWIVDPTVTPTSGNYVSYDALLGASLGDFNGFLQPGQAVFFEGNGTASNSITLQKKYALTSVPLNTVYSANTPPSIMRIKLQDAASVNLDGAIIGFSEDFVNDVNGDDSIKFLSSSNNLARNNGGSYLAIERRALPVDGESLPLYLTVDGSGTYYLDFEPLTITGMTPYLLDNETGVTTVISGTQSTSYIFDVNDGNAAALDSRFEIVWQSTTLSTKPVAAALLEIQLYPNPSQGEYFNIDFNGIQGDKSIEIFNLLGQKIITYTTQQSNVYLVSNLDLTTGTYLIKITTEKGEQTEKLLVE